MEVLRREGVQVQISPRDQLEVNQSREFYTGPIPHSGWTASTATSTNTTAEEEEEDSFKVDSK